MPKLSQPPLLYDWPVRHRLRDLEIGYIVDCHGDRLIELAAREVLGRHSAGWWECDLFDNRLTWTTGVYRLFGLPDGSQVTRDQAVALYSNESREEMERLRTYAIANGTGFAVDVEIRPADGSAARWMRLIGAPVIEQGRICRLHGLKLQL